MGEMIKYNGITVVLLQYNSSLQKIMSSLNSIVNQKDVIINIVVADDGSQNNYFKEISKFLDNRKVNYQFVSHKKNVGTVINYLDALEFVKTDYVMSLGQGDLFYNEHVLYDLSKEIDDDYCFVFGNLVNFANKNGKPELVPVLSNPQFPNIYNKRNNKIIKRNYLIFKDLIGGSSVLYNTKKLIEYLNIIKGKVMFTEDSIIRIMIYNEELIKYTNLNFVYYEYGNGISTNSDSPYRKQLKQDWSKVTEIIIEKCKQNMSHLDNRIIRVNDYKKKNRHYLLERICFNLKNLDYFVFRMKKRINPNMTSVVLENSFLIDNLILEDEENE